MLSMTPDSPEPPSLDELLQLVDELVAHERACAQHALGHERDDDLWTMQQHRDAEARRRELHARVEHNLSLLAGWATGLRAALVELAKSSTSALAAVMPSADGPPQRS